jgi:hypothetical protein
MYSSKLYEIGYLVVLITLIIIPDLIFPYYLISTRFCFRLVIGLFYIILVNDQLDALFLNAFISCLYMFRAASAHHQQAQIVLIINLFI